MGQYYYIVNLDKQQYLHPHNFHDGLKLLEFGCSDNGTMAGLAILLADGNGRGGGDLRAEDPIIGSWAGDRIVIAGDYADGNKFIEDAPQEELQEVADEVYNKGFNEPQRVTLHTWAKHKFENISPKVIEVLAKDSYLRSQLMEKGCATKAGTWQDPFAKYHQE